MRRISYNVPLGRISCFPTWGLYFYIYIYIYRLFANPCDAWENSKNEIFMKHSKYSFLIKKFKSDRTPTLALTYYTI